jgi:hypothetical protein
VHRHLYGRRFHCLRASDFAFVVAAGVTPSGPRLTKSDRTSIAQCNVGGSVRLQIFNPPGQVHAPIERAYIGYDGGHSCSTESVLARRRERLDDHRVKSGLGNERNLGSRSGRSSVGLPK